MDINTILDINKLVTDKSYGLKSDIKVISFKSKLYNNMIKTLKDIKPDEDNWLNKVTELKRLICEEEDKATRFILRYDKTYLNDDNINTFGLFRSIVTDGKKILSFSPPKSSNLDYFNSNSEGDGLEYLEYVEGTMINMYHDDGWKIASRSSIGADVKFYRESDKTFKKMFMNAFVEANLEFSMFSKDYCYSFVLQHPENRIVVPFNKSKIILTNIYKCDGFTVKEIDFNDKGIKWINDENREKINHPRNIRDVVDLNNIKDNNIEDIAKSISCGVDYTIVGMVVCNRTKGIRYKVRNPNYETVRRLRGNNSKIQYHYYTLRKTGDVGNYLSYYPEYKEQFTNLRAQLHHWTYALWSNYVSCYIKKDRPLKSYPFEFRTHMFNLHSLYLNKLRNDGYVVTRRVVINYINELPSEYLMSSINYPLRKNEILKNIENITENLQN